MKISTKIFITFAAILFLFSIATLVNFLVQQEVKENSKWVSQSQIVIRNAARLQRNIIDIESDLRGYLLTRDDFFIISSDSLTQENKRMFGELRGLVGNNKYQRNRLDTIQMLHTKWREKIAKPLIKGESLNQGPISTSFTLLERNKEEKLLRNRIIEEFKEFNNREYDKRDIRKARLNESLARTRQISILLTVMSIFIGFIVSAYLVKIISRRIFKMVNLADGIANGDFNVEINDNSKDELSNLSFSLDQMAKTLKENFSELEKKNKELDQFAYVVSHDLKAPLRGIENICTWIEEDLKAELSPKMKEYLALLTGRAKRMENLIQGILDLSKVGKGKKILEEVDTSELINEVVDMLSPGSRFKITVPEHMPVFVTERISLHQVFSNLISNSIKYHDKSFAKIEIKWEEDEEYYKFYVSDDGPGISPKYHQKIFMVFQTLKERDAFESTGVGLSIVKKILNEKKSFIEVFSDEGKGSTFVFTWPKNID
ncbi:MAG TPA: ATP-binding protein [Cytophagales bacterium]|nr:ATP-binding protein [Cytophagales bacterium]